MPIRLEVLKAYHKQSLFLQVWRIHQKRKILTCWKCLSPFPLSLWPLPVPGFFTLTKTQTEYQVKYNIHFKKLSYFSHSQKLSPRLSALGQDLHVVDFLCSPASRWRLWWRWTWRPQSPTLTPRWRRLSWWKRMSPSDWDAAAQWRYH